MYKLAVCCLLFIGALRPLASLPVTVSGNTSPLLPALDEDARWAVEEPRGASALQLLPEVLGTERGAGLREADPSTDIFTPRGNPRKAFSRQDPNVLLSKLLAKTRKQHKQPGTRLECFWKYCV